MNAENQITLAPTGHNQIEAFNAYMNHILTSPDYSTEDRIKYSRLAASDECWLLDTVWGCGITYEKSEEDKKREMEELLHSCIAASSPLFTAKTK